MVQMEALQRLQVNNFYVWSEIFVHLRVCFIFCKWQHRYFLNTSLFHRVYLKLVKEIQLNQNYSAKPDKSFLKISIANQMLLTF